MATQDIQTNGSESGRKGFSRQQLFGLFFVLAGIVYLLKRLNIGLPDWLFGWEMVLILIGLYTGIANRFRDQTWAIPILIGLIFILDDVLPDLSIRRLIWPIGMIVVGVIIMTKGNRYTWWQKRRNQSGADAAIEYNGDEATPVTLEASNSTEDDRLEATAVFGGVKRSIVSKQFKGGEVTAIMGGAEINLAYADIQGITRIEIVCIMGGAKLVVPAHWDVQSRMVAILGGVDDKRNIRPELIDPNRRLIIEGTSLMGGVEIRSY